MKRVLLCLAAALSVSSCGLYTNVPAQYHVAEVKPASLTYQKPDTDGYRSIEVVPGQVTVVGEPGSIGVTFDSARVSYVSDYSRGQAGLISEGEISTLNLRMSLRVESSNYPSDPTGGAIDQKAIGQATYVGRNTVTLPVVTRHVEDYGMKTAINASAITAQVTFKGTDDAGFPAELVVYVPITFHGAPGQGQAKP